MRQLHDQEGRQMVRLRWGLIRGWARDRRIGNRLLFARAETAAEKPAFREAFRRRRCLVPADGFYVWKKGQGKEPLCVALRDGRVFAFAGLWEQWQGPHREVIESCAIMTIPANDLVLRFQDRMPAIVHPEQWAAWLRPGLQDPQQIRAMLHPYPSAEMMIRPIKDQAS